MKTLMNTAHSAAIRADAFACQHPYLSLAAAFAAVPLGLVTAVSLFTAVTALPLALLMGWI